MIETSQKLDRYLKYLEQDPANLRLIQDAADAAFAEGEDTKAQELVERYAALAPPPPALLNLAGLSALRLGAPEKAAGLFAQVLESEPANAAVRCNLAWTKAAGEDWPAVDQLLDDATVTAEPRAAVLKVRAFQHEGRPEDAIGWAQRLAVARPGRDPALDAALATAALDAEDRQLAATYAKSAGARPEALATLGHLALEAGEVDEASALFAQALAIEPAEARAQLGAGLARLARNDAAGALPWLDRAAQGFKTHLGSWVAAGWAAFAAGDLVAARQRFAAALALDNTFAESHGALAVLDLLAGRADLARRGVEVALRLDKHCFAGLLGEMLLLQSEGQAQSAERLRQMAINLPIGSSGLTIASAMALLRR